MPEQLRFEWTYPTIPIATFRMATRLDHLEEKARYLGHERHAVLELRERDGLFWSVTERQVDVDLPTWAPRLFKPRNMIKQTQTWKPPEWDGHRQYSSTVEVTSIPVRIVGGGELIPVGFGETRYTISLTVQSTARFIGRKVEAIVTGALRRAIEGEHDFRLQWLNRPLPHTL